MTSHGGQIQVEYHARDQPARPLEQPAKAGARDPTTLPPGQRVLAVEDNPEILRSLVDPLRESGCQGIEAADDLTALARIEMESFDLVLADMAMPRAAGWQVATACRERFPAAPTR